MEVLSVVFLPLLVIVTAVVVYFLCPGFCRSTKEYFQSFSRNKSGQDLIEYALIIGFIAVAAGTIVPGVAKVSFGKIGATLGQNSLGEVGPTPTINWFDFNIDIVMVVCALLVAVVIIKLIILRRRKRWENG